MYYSNSQSSEKYTLLMLRLRSATVKSIFRVTRTRKRALSVAEVSFRWTI